MIIERTSRTIRPGRFYPLGATPEPGGVNFALYTRHAEEVFLLLYDDPRGEPTDVIRMDHSTRHIRHVFVEGVGAGQLYAYRVQGAYHPSQGLRYNGHKLLLDPYAKAITGKVANTDGLLYPYDREGSADLTPDLRDSGPVMPRGIVVDDAFDWQGDAAPQVEFEKMVIYEVHLKGFTAHPSSGVSHPGTYLGFIEKIPYLKELGVNAVEFLPVQEFYVEDFLVTNGLTNYWGYNTICFFAPESSYSTGSYPGCQVQEFKTLVRELHRAGIEVILDVVYNHTGEGNELGPMISLKGIDNPSYYCLTGPPEDPQRYYMNYSGCGNSMKLADRHVLRLVMDSLRYWVEEMHVDGFRFDLASELGRTGAGGYDRASAFFAIINQDPVLRAVKLISEPWDLGLGGYQVGNFPAPWCEWNGKYRDALRRYWKGD
ncbi:MAG TPA: alpha-amylase family glycosyl hydrolase, partial [Verrucomicrobiae bacterium]|nr:alpha-amylase family glycosyl hydrolase [Verrucomicrobiae bacterium]